MGFSLPLPPPLSPPPNTHTHLCLCCGGHDLRVFELEPGLGCLSRQLRHPRLRRGERRHRSLQLDLDASAVVDILVPAALPRPLPLLLLLRARLQTRRGPGSGAAAAPAWLVGAPEHEAWRMRRSGRVGCFHRNLSGGVEELA